MTRRLALLAALLTLVALVVPQSTVRRTDVALVEVHTAQAVDHPRSVVWLLCLGSDARPGEALLHQRADAIQLVGLNLETGAGTMIGIPRDSFVEIPGHGRNKINASMTFGGPQMMAASVGRLVGIRPDYVFTTGFDGFRAMVRAIGGVTVNSRFAFSDPIRPQGYKKGPNKLTAYQALIFGRVRHPLPRGDFDRSANQQELLRSILRRVRGRESGPGFMERGVLAAVENMNTDLAPAQLFRLAQAVTQVDPARLHGCVLDGRPGFAGAASVVFPNVPQARRLGDDARRDGTLDRGCRAKG
ncbi:MAG: polyisoprenyl-teichoic acid--peptidoglycan teichoic acid transferase [Nocardioidaceae bacterium]|jgi:LCP family protein required for cell wall assembly|nr:polyisoprenyl-teichoic acid--peptidoglycan teichoic acid transferase [Nocardioidaceae bacterium]